MANEPTSPDTDSNEAEQRETIEFLANPATHGCDHVEHITTHISHVFIAGDRTYKLKRAVARSFVDYSTLQKRKALCERELAVNVENAPEIYLAVRAIYSTPAGLTLCDLNAPGTPVDYVVEMRTFAADDNLDTRAQSGTLNSQQIEELADTIADQHKRVPNTSAYGGAAAVRQTIDELAKTIESTPCGPALMAPLTKWSNAAKNELSRHVAQLEARRHHGYVRRCHGDLHLANICLIDGHPRLFDAIEFSEQIASIDVLYDIAFTAMDLLYRDLRPQANSLLSRYLNLTRDYSGLTLMPLFVSMRATVRAMVAAAGTTKEHKRDAAHRLDFAIRCLEPQPKPQLIAVGGLSGSGKSTLARQLAAKIPGLFGALMIRSDVCRKRLFNVAPEAPLPDTAYKPHVSQQVYEIMRKDAHRALKAGTSVILDATYREQSETESLAILAKNLGTEFTGFWLSADLETLKDRITKRSSDASDATPQIAAKQWQNMSDKPGWIILNANRPPEDIAAEALQSLGLCPPHTD
ncbi:MAG: AAA family ATPase [Filomicrobium sp.]